MKHNSIHIYYLLFFLVSIVAGCRSNKAVIQPQSSTVDSTVVRYERIIEKDTVYVTLPAQKQSVVTRDSCSLLENDYALSVASIGADGMLSHTLTLKDTPLPVAIDKVTIVRDTITSKAETIRIPEPYPVEVEKKLSTWHKVQIIGFWAFVFIIIFLSYVKIRKKAL